MAAVSDVAALAFHLAEGCRRFLEPLLCFLSGPSPRSPAVDAAAVFLLVVLPTAFVAGVFVAHFAGVAPAYLNLLAPAPVPAPGAGVSFPDLWRFVVMVFTLVFAWLLVIAAFLAFFYFFFLDAGKRGTRPGFSSWSVLS